MIYSIASQKGGVGKSVTSITLAAYLARHGKKTLLVDCDAQANSSKAIIEDYTTSIKAEESTYATVLNRKPLTVRETYLDNLFIVPSHILLSDTDIELTTAIDHREARLKTELDKIKDQYEYIFIDCPPALSWLTINAMVASDKVIIVVSPGYFELDSLIQISKSITEVKGMFNPSLELAGLLFTMSDPTVNSRTSLQILRQTYTDKVFKSVIPRNTDIRDALFNHKDIFAFDPASPSAQAYAKLAVELFGV